MAVSNRFLAILAAVAICLGAWSVGSGLLAIPRLRRISTSEEKARSALADSATRLGLQVRNRATLNRVDSARAMYRGGQVPEVLVAGVAPAAASLAESLFLSIPKPANPAVPMRLVLLDKPLGSPWPRGMLGEFAVISETPGDGSCTTVRLVSATDTVLERSELEWWRWVPWNGSIGPCWFLTRFGPPGAQVRSWLDSRYWDVAGAIPPVHRRREEEDGDASTRGLMSRLFGDLTGMFYDGSIVLEGCAGRRPELCQLAFLEPPYSPALVPDGIVGNGRLGYLLEAARGRWMLELPRSESRVLLALMVDDLGPDRFTAFWTSAAPVPEAFEAAVGMTLGDWYRTQLRKQMLADGLPEPRSAPFWPSALGMLALALGGSLWLGGRREVR